MSISQRQLFLQHLAIPSDADHALEIVKARGIYLYDTNGKEYIDLVSGVSVSNLGHGHPSVIRAVQKQAEVYMHLMVYGKYIQSPQVKFAKRLADNLPDQLQSVFFVNSGSEAIEGALKLAKRATGRSEIIAFKNAYHGSTHGALSVLGNENMKYGYRPLLPEIRFLDFNNFDQLDQVMNNCAAVLVEPVQAEAGIIIPEEGYLKEISKKCQQSGTLLIFDEIQMGFGRTGKLFAYEHFGVIPDILCLAKAMGGGMPIGAFISSKEKMDLLKSNPALGHITTFGGHPVCAAAGLASLEVIINEKLPEKASAKGKMFADSLKEHSTVKEIRQIGLMLGIELVDNKSVSKLLELFLAEGIIVDQFLFNSKSFRIAPPLTITEKEVVVISVKIKNCLDQL